MFYGQVIGEIWASVKVASLNSAKLLVVRSNMTGSEIVEVVAVDLVGAGKGDDVLVALGQAARNALGQSDAAVEAAVIAVIDGIDVIPQDQSPTPKAKKPVRKKKVSAKKSASKKSKQRPVKGLGFEAGSLFPEMTEKDELEVTASEMTIPFEEEVVEELKVIPEADEIGIDDVDSLWDEDEEIEN